MSIHQKSSLKHPTAGVILAAGLSSRFGKQKQLADFRGRPLLEWVLDACMESKLKHLVLVLGHDWQKIMKTLSSQINSPLVEAVINLDYARGQSSSLQKGLGRIRNSFPSVMFLLGDQPMLDYRTINFLLEQYHQSERNICVPYHNNRRRNPTIFSSRYYDEIMNITGDRGARNIIDINDNDVLRVELHDPALFHDIDTADDLQYGLSIQRIDEAIKR